MTKKTTVTTTKKFNNIFNIIEEIGRLALEALLFEVSVTPKPGLVDRNNSGSHNDMNYFTFMTSASSLGTCFFEFAIKGFELAEKNIKPENVLSQIRQIGINAEQKMFNATHGINTHKGEIFSLGLLSACAGYLSYSKEKFFSDEILDLASQVCYRICENDFANIKKKSPDELTKNLTKGEIIFLKYGISGVRGEAQNGYPCVKKSLPILKSLIKTLNINDALAITLLKIISENSDTNIISRHDLKTLRYAQNIASEKFDFIINHKTENKTENFKKILLDLDNDFISKNISPSGSADLLAVTYFLYSLENI